MARSNSNFTALFDVELDTSGIEKQLRDATKNIKVNLDTGNVSKGLNDIADSAGNVSSAMEDTNLTFQAANMIFQQSVDIISSMVDQVFELDSAITEFTKVSDLSGESLDNYISKLNTMGDSVARTGKPKCLSQSVWMVNMH